LQLFRTQKQFDSIGKDIEILKQYGVPFEVLDRIGCGKHEPALALVKEKFVGALHLPGDETGDCFKFTKTIAKMAEHIGPLAHITVLLSPCHRRTPRWRLSTAANIAYQRRGSEC
jgi:glycine/D-amino acid oxidase-like deaminating enzyme